MGRLHIYLCLLLAHQVAIHSSFHHLLDKFQVLNNKKSSDTDLAVKVTWATVTGRMRVEVSASATSSPETVTSAVSRVS